MEYNLLLALALEIQIRKKDKNRHTVIECESSIVLIDLEDCSFFEYDKRLYDLVKPFNDASDNELLDRIIELAEKIKQGEKYNSSIIN